MHILIEVISARHERLTIVDGDGKTVDAGGVLESEFIADAGADSTQVALMRQQHMTALMRAVGAMAVDE